MEDLSLAIKLLHSSAPDSAEKLRSLLNTEILKHFDKSKLIENSLNKKQMEGLIACELKSVGSNFKIKKHKTKKVEEIKIATTPVISENQQIIKTHELDDDSSDNSSSAMDLLSDLTCVSCRQMDNSANNQLFECIECHQLFHQLCHSTKIPNDANPSSWLCSTCKKKEGTPKPSKSYESSSSSSNSSFKQKEKEKEKEREKEKEQKEKEKSSTEKRKSEGSSSSSSKSSKKSKESSSSSSSSRRSSSKKST